MSVQNLAAPAPAMPAARLVSIVGLTLALAFTIILAGALVGGTWLIDAHGQPIANDFVNVWAAGRLALDGHAAAAYDWTLHKAAEVEAVGHAFDNYYGWHYPPTFLFAAATLALLPYTAAALIWLGVTLPLYVAAVRSIVGDRVALFIALGSPAALWNVTAGQNGFLTAALIGGTLGLMRRRPVLAGICLGLLSYKPQFGLLFPIALIAGREWRVIATAALTAIAMAALSLAVVGAASWQAFFDWAPVTSRVVLGEGGADFARLQSVFGFVRAHGGSEALAWSVQGMVALASIVGIAWLWRSRCDYGLKAAALACAALLATPYLYMYDLVVLTIPAAFLLRLALTNGFKASETIGLSAAIVLLGIFPYVKANVGLAAVVVIALLIARRVRAAFNDNASQRSIELR
jgi:hypothetical protein